MRIGLVTIVQQPVAYLPWGHNVRILDQVKSPVERQWYIEQTIANGWSRNILVLQIQSGLHGRQGRAIPDFTKTLPENLQSSLPTIEELEAELSRRAEGEPAGA